MFCQQAHHSRILPMGEDNPHPLQGVVWAEFQHQGSERYWQPLNEAHLHGQPLIWQGMEEKRRTRATQPNVGTRGRVTMAWTPVLLLLLSHCTGPARTSGHKDILELVRAVLPLFLRKFTVYSQSPMSVCVFRLCIPVR